MKHVTEQLNQDLLDMALLLAAKGKASLDDVRDRVLRQDAALMVHERCHEIEHCRGQLVKQEMRS